MKRMAIRWLAGLLLVAVQLAATAAERSWDAVDRFALAAPADAEKSIAGLGAYLRRGAADEAGRARAIFRWMTDRIEYDIATFLAGRENEMVNISADEVLASRKAICHGYAILFAALARAAGLEADILRGYAKGYGRAANLVFVEPNHAWNVVKQDGAWKVVDVTWGAGYVFQDRYFKQLDELYFHSQPARLRFTHLPLASHAGHRIEMSKAEFEALPPIDPGLFRAGVSGEWAWEVAHRPGFRAFVPTYDQNQRDLKIVAAPLEQFIRAGQPVQFQYETARFDEIAVIHDGGWVKLEKNGTRFSGRFPVQAGGALVTGKPSDGSRYTGLFQYTAE